MELHDFAYKPSDIGFILRKTFNHEKPKGMYNSKKKLKYYNKACAFDIEVTSTIIDGKKAAFMYAWMLGLDGYCILGRTWEEFGYCVKEIIKYLKLDSHTLLPIYVHNLSYEMQFIKDRFKWSEILALSERQPIYCRAVCGIEFRCSYKLSGYSLAKVGENLRKYKVKKMVGDLDYSLVRNSKTKLSKEEISYCVHDVLVVMAYIQECIDDEGWVCNIPLTKTGYVRRYVKHMTIGRGRNKNKRYMAMIKKLTLEPDEYLELRDCFQGGFTHASPIYSDELLTDVDAFDFTSSYPAVMLSEKFPMSKGFHVIPKSAKDFYWYLNNFCCMFEVTFTNIICRELFDDYISYSHCRNVGDNLQLNNGRVVKCDSITTTVTELDFDIIKRMYKWDAMNVTKMICYEKGYLPTEFVEAIVKLYEDKTQLKGVEGKEVEYMQAKANLNSLYGMTVTDIIRDEIGYDSERSEWVSEKPELTQMIERYNKGTSRFLFYPWGVWVTAYARHNLWSGILSVRNDYVYADTDSIKMLNASEHMDYIETYNRNITLKIENAMKWHGIPNVRTAPKTIEGVSKPIGVWDFEGHYTRFKTLGAKRYIWEDSEGRQEITVAGLGKKDALKYLQSKGNPFELFTRELNVPAGHAGKMTHTYIDIPCHGLVEDYQGNYAYFDELSSVYLEPAAYQMSMAASYAQYLMHVKEMIS